MCPNVYVWLFGTISNSLLPMLFFSSSFISLSFSQVSGSFGFSSALRRASSALSSLTCFFNLLFDSFKNLILFLRRFITFFDSMLFVFHLSRLSLKMTTSFLTGLLYCFLIFVRLQASMFSSSKIVKRINIPDLKMKI